MFKRRQIRVIGVSQTEDGVWKYHVELLDADGRAAQSDFVRFTRRYIVRRRYREFRQLYETLVDASPRPLPCKLPSHGLWSLIKSNDPHFLKQRMRQLELMLRQLDDFPPLRQHPVLVDFLQPEPCSPCTDYASFTEYQSPDIR